MWTRVMRESPNLWLLLTFPAAHWLWCRCGGPIWHHGDQGNLLGMTELQERNLGPQSYQASPSSFTPRNKILERNKILSSPCYHYFGFVLELINLYSLYSNWSSIFFCNRIGARTNIFWVPTVCQTLFTSLGVQRESPIWWSIHFTKLSKSHMILLFWLPFLLSYPSPSLGD